MFHVRLMNVVVSLPPVTCEHSNDKDKLGQAHNMIGLRSMDNCSQSDRTVVLSDPKPGVSGT